MINRQTQMICDYLGIELVVIHNFQSVPEESVSNDPKQVEIHKNLHISNTKE